MPHYLFRWRSRPDIAQLENENAGLRTTIVQLRHELKNKGSHVGRLKCLVRERSERIDQLNATIDWLRQQNKALDAEADRLAEMVRLSP